MSDTAHVQWSACRFFWAVLEAPGWRKSGELPTGLRHQFEDECPISGEQLHAVCTPMPESRLLVCAVQRDDLADVESHILSITPDQVPHFADGIVPHEFNMLVGRFEPVLVLRARRRTHLMAAATVAIVCMLTAIGLHRRGEQSAEASLVAYRAASELIRSSGQPNEESLTREVARLRSAARGNAEIERPVDAAWDLGDILGAWPARSAAKTQSISVAANGAAIVASVEADPTDFIASFRAIAGWVMQEPRLNRVDGVSRVTLHLRRTAEKQP